MVPTRIWPCSAGAIDGVLCAWGWVNNFKLNEVTTYHTLQNLNPGTYSSVMNKDAQDKLTPDEQQHLRDITPLYFFYNTTNGAAARWRAFRRRTSSRCRRRTGPGSSTR
ncbi:MAG: hypothetical protein M5R42_10660 [Rhodocyclaceae bacterium]|nr:hypothetical protein [Rhodocyclaceae bacterium]